MTASKPMGFSGLADLARSESNKPIGTDPLDSDAFENVGPDTIHDIDATAALWAETTLQECIDTLTKHSYSVDMDFNGGLVVKTPAHATVRLASRQELNRYLARSIPAAFPTKLTKKQAGIPASQNSSTSSSARSPQFSLALGAVLNFEYVQLRDLVKVNPKLCHETDEDGRTLLLAAASVGAMTIVSFLLESGSNPSHRDNKGRSAMDLVESNPSILVKARESIKSELSELIIKG